MTRQAGRPGKPGRPGTLGGSGKAGGNARRRGMTVLVMVVLLGAITLAVVGSVTPTADDAQLLATRVESARAFYGAESGVYVLIGELTRSGGEPPESGATLELEGATVVFESVPDGNGTAVIRGASGRAVRQIELDLE